MSGRPEILFPLFADIKKLAGVGPRSAQNLENMAITRPKDLLFTLPHGGIDRKIRESVSDIQAPSVVTVQVEVGLHHPNTAKTRPYRITVRDAKTSFQLVFFHARADWLRKNLPSGQRRVISGKLELFDGVAQMVHPDHILPENQAEQIPAFEPQYPLTAGITQKMMFKAVMSAQDKLPDLAEWIEPSILRAQNWPGWRFAITAAHAPNNNLDISPFAPPRTRLAYDELFAHQLTLALARARRNRAVGIASVATGVLQGKVLKTLPYTSTAAQTRAVVDITKDMAKPNRMNRLLQGDVGSGKTLVAMLAMLAAVEAGGQAVMMAPTEILARQHLDSLRPMADAAGVEIEILTGRDKGQTRQIKTQKLATGEIGILLGTHAVFQKDVEFKDLRLAVIDEQHRFGVRQRMELGKKGQAVDVLVMTATPIPRSLELAQYGDMDISVLDEKPPGRQPIKTAIVAAGRMENVLERLKSAINAGQQAYWVCPLVEESELVEWTAASDRHRVLRKVLGEENVGLVHGQMPVEQKDRAMLDFQQGRTKVLVATTVIEVGVDVPNATIMVVEAAERFGLAQLHQLRGRVGRGNVASTCLLLYSPPLGPAQEQRLNVMRDTNDGFVIAQEDLKLRGAGDVLGLQQSGLPKFRIADLESQTDLMKMAHDDARYLLVQDPDLKSQRGQAARVLLYLTDQDQAIRLISVG